RCRAVGLTGFVIERGGGFEIALSQVPISGATLRLGETAERPRLAAGVAELLIQLACVVIGLGGKVLLVQVGIDVAEFEQGTGLAGVILNAAEDILRVRIVGA